MKAIADGDLNLEADTQVEANARDQRSNSWPPGLSSLNRLLGAGATDRPDCLVQRRRAANLAAKSHGPQ